MELNNIINNILSKSHKSDLDKIKQHIQYLDIHPNYPIILVGGTNGKGSVCAYLNNILINAGFNVGCFTSPHVFKYNERITINNIPISDDDLIHYINKTEASNELGLFQILTLACHQYFIHQNIDIAIIEVGIGGRMDVTNLFEPSISAITSISLDHIDILGDTLDKIAFEKAHIFRPKKPAFFGGNTPPQALFEYCKTHDIELKYYKQDFEINKNELSFDVITKNKKYFTLPYPLLRGDIQPVNIALSLAILESLSDKFPITVGQIKTGIIKTHIPGRFQVLPGLPQIVLDVAHNIEAVTLLLSNMIKLPFAKQNFAVFGIAKDKDTEQIVNKTHDKFDKWFIAKIDNERGMNSNEIKELLLKHKVDNSKIFEYDDIALACEASYRQLNEQDRMVCFGSFLVVEKCHNKIQELRK